MTPALGKSGLSRATGDLLALGVLGALALFVAGFLLRDDVFIYGDHPGHYWLTWYTLNIAVPLHHRLLDWIPYWYAGYPELQFTPPGYLLLGWALNVLTLGKFSAAFIYAMVAFIGYALPGFTFYYAVRHLDFGRRTAFSAGLFALVFPAFFDGAPGAFIGMIGSRLAFGLNALFFAWTIDVLERRGARYFFAAALTLAAIVLAHPYHTLGILFALGLYILARRLPRVPSAMQMIALVACAAALDAFWLAPLFAHSSGAMVPMLRATLDQTWRILTDASLAPFAVLALFALGRVRRERDVQSRVVILVVLALPFVLAGGMLVAHLVLIEPQRFFQLDPIRLIGEYYFALIWLAALGASELTEWLGRFVARPSYATWTRALATAGIGAFFAISIWQTVAFFHPRPNAEPRFLSQAIRDYRLAELWDTLRDTPGRVWFTSYATELNARGTESLATTLMSLTPLYTNRELMGGTYSHWSPVAARMWTGQTHPRVLRGLNHEQDNRALFGVPLESFTEAQLVAECERYNITAIVASVNDERTRAVLDAMPRVQSYFNNGFFFVYRIKNWDGAWLAAENATVELIAKQDDQIIMRVRAAQADARVRVKIQAYPLWRAVTDRGERLTITADDFALMQIALPRGDDYIVTLRYAEDTVEHIGNSISILFIVVGGAGVLFAFARQRFQF
ncbi:MAG: hypothetical protein HY868_07305 [Chloroflexi bacterium]|nr:hypothetical protein [Chloroflexota bacterium]